MNDILGIKLQQNRINTVLPFASGYLLDIGCGMNKLVRQYGNGIGVDVFDWGDLDLLVEDTSKLPFNDNSFDTITVLAALNHIPNREEVIKETFRLLKDDGSVIITMLTPRVSKIWHFLRKPWDEDQKKRKMKENEVFGFTKKQILEMFGSMGFDLYSHKKFMLGLNSLFVFKKKNQ